MDGVRGMARGWVVAMVRRGEVDGQLGGRRTVGWMGWMEGSLVVTCVGGVWVNGDVVCRWVAVCVSGVRMVCGRRRGGHEDGGGNGRGVKR